MGERLREPPSTRKSVQIVTLAGVILCGMAVAAAVFSFLRHAYGVTRFPYELAAGEELLLRDALHISTGQPVYTEVNEFPFVVSNYPPLFALLSSWLIPALGIGLAATRAVGTLSTVGCACLVGVIVHQAGRARVPSALCGAAFLGSLFVYQWGAWGRVDPTALLFSLAAIFVMQRWPSMRGVYAGALLSLLSLFTKQTQWAAPLAIVAWLAWRREVRKALAFALLLGGVGGLAFLSLNAATSGQFFRHLVAYNALAYSPRALLGYWRAFLLTHGVLLAVALAYGAVSLRRGRPSLPAVYFAASALLTLGVGRAGASTNYFLELIAASLILCGRWWSELWGRRLYLAAALPVALSLQLVWFWAFPSSPLHIFYDPLPAFGYTPQAADLAACKRIDGYVAEVEGPILTEGGGFALKNGKEVVASPWLLSALAEKGLADEGLDRLEDAIQGHRFGLVVLTWQSYPPRILEAVWASYLRVDTLDCVFTYEVFVPKQPG
jgi:hypothetical protein